MKKWYRMGGIILSAVVAFSILMISRELWIQQREKKEFQELQKIVYGEECTEEAKQSEKLCERKRNLSTLYERNSDCIGWLCIPDTQINYPVMYTPDEPQKYLNKNFDGAYSYSGIPFLDERCELNIGNLIIYGHNMNNGTMFADVMKYAKKDYFINHQVIVFETLTECREYQIFAVMKTDTGNDWYHFIDAESREEYDGFIERVKMNSLYDTEVTPIYGKQILTLSTCTNRGKEERFLIAAVKK